MYDQDLPQFRTAVGGFHKGDVSSYIVQMSKEHQIAIAEKQRDIYRLQQSNQQLQDEFDSYRAQNEASLAEAAALKDQLASFQFENEELKSESDLLRQQLNAVSCQPVSVETGGRADEHEELTISEQELEAYRRAEETERKASIRADRVYSELNSVLAMMSGGVLDTDQGFQKHFVSLQEQLQEMQQSLDDLSKMLDQAKTRLEIMSCEPTDEHKAGEEHSL